MGGELGGGGDIDQAGGDLAGERYGFGLADGNLAGVRIQIGCGGLWPR